jgi:hypothetical protein
LPTRTSWTMNITLLWNITSCSLVCRSRRFERQHRLHFQPRSHIFILKFEALLSFTTSVMIYQSTRRHIPWGWRLDSASLRHVYGKSVYPETQGEGRYCLETAEQWGSVWGLGVVGVGLGVMGKAWCLAEIQRWTKPQWGSMSAWLHEEKLLFLNWWAACHGDNWRWAKRDMSFRK